MKRESFIAVSITMVYTIVFSSVVFAQLSKTQARIDLKSVDLALADLQTDHLIVERPSWVVRRKSADWGNTFGNFETLREEVAVVVPSHPKYVIEYRRKFEHAISESMYNSGLVGRSSRSSSSGLDLSRTLGLSQYSSGVDEKLDGIADPHLEARDFLGGSGRGLLYGRRREGYMQLRWAISF